MRSSLPPDADDLLRGFLHTLCLDVHGLLSATHAHNSRHAMFFMQKLLMPSFGNTADSFLSAALGPELRGLRRPLVGFVTNRSENQAAQVIASDGSPYAVTL